MGALLMRSRSVQRRKGHGFRANLIELEARTMLAGEVGSAPAFVVPTDIPAWPAFEGLSVKRVPGYLGGLTLNQRVITPPKL